MESPRGSTTADQQPYTRSKQARKNGTMSRKLIQTHPFGEITWSIFESLAGYDCVTACAFALAVDRYRLDGADERPEKISPNLWDKAKSETDALKERQRTNTRNASQRKKPTPVELPPDADFDAFFQAYPKQENKFDARRAWEEVKDIRPDLKTILASVAQFNRATDGPRYAPQAARWLRERRWNDKPSAQEDWSRNVRAYDPATELDDAE